MRRYREKITVLAAILLAIACLSRGVIAADIGAVNASSWAIATGGNATNNTLTCNFGLTPEQLHQITKAAVEGATGPLMGQIVDVSKQLGITEDAAKTLLRIVGEQTDVPDERLAEVLTNQGRQRLQEVTGSGRRAQSGQPDGARAHRTG